jgi:hypothetical protein
MVYSRNLRRLCREIDVNQSAKVESYFFGLEVTNKYRNALFDSYYYYCKANEIQWDRPRVKTEAYPVARAPLRDFILNILI